MFRLMIDLGFDLVLYSDKSFETREAAAMAAFAEYSDYTAMEVVEQSALDAITKRKVVFGVPKV